MRPLLYVAFLLLALPRTVAAQANSIVGHWRGSSTCVDKEHYPTCRDEVVDYDVTATAGTSDTVQVKASRVLGEVMMRMGELPFVRGDSGTWVAEFKSTRYNARWVVTTDGTTLTGRLEDAANGAVVRRISLKRVIS